MQKKPSPRRRSKIPKSLLLPVFTLIFSLSSVGLMEDFQGNFWLKTYLLLGLLLWGNLFIYLGFYPHWGQRLLELKNGKNRQLNKKKDFANYAPVEEKNKQ